MCTFHILHTILGTTRRGDVHKNLLSDLQVPENGALKIILHTGT
jgi:hypothetical protein